MSSELKSLKGREEVHVARFFGGEDRGTCVQLTQDVHDGPWDDAQTMYVQLSEDQLRELVKRAKKILNLTEKEEDDEPVSNRVGYIYFPPKDC